MTCLVFSLEEGEGAWCTVGTCFGAEDEVMAASPHALIAASSNRLPTMFLTRVRL
jgi:hypothetical protein